MAENILKAVFLQKIVFDIPQLLRKVDIIGVGIFKPGHLAPQAGSGVFAVFLYFIYSPFAVNALALFKKLFHYRLGLEVFKSLLFPCKIGIENRIGLCVVYDFIVKGYDIGNIVAVFPA